ncbi:hypothetical protein [Enterobacter sp. CPE_E423]|uniref:hypothetical protein n=1 Tax=unclassified Enterobacter TaxID=2608935 RepID=UPI003975CFE7
MGEISVKTGNNARNGGKNSLNRLIRCVCGKKIGPDPRNFNQRVSLGRNDLLIRTFPKEWYHLALCDSAIALIDEMCKRYPDSSYIFPDIWYEQKKARYLEKEKNGT